MCRPMIFPNTFVDCFDNKIDRIRESTKDAPLPFNIISIHYANSLCTAAEVEELKCVPSTKQCELDSANGLLLKSLYIVFASNLAFLVVIVIVNSRFLQISQRRSRGKQFIHRRLSKAKSIGSGSDPESQAGRQSDGYGGW